MNLKPQDLLVAFKLVSWGQQRWTYARLSQELGISTSEAHACIKRGIASGLLQRQEPTEAPTRRGVRTEAAAAKPAAIERRVGRAKKEPDAVAAPSDNPARVAMKALAEFVVHGARYVFVAELLPACRGVPTGVADPLFARPEAGTPIGAPTGSPTDSHVWPHPQGTATGTGIKPLHPNVPFAAMQDAQLYELLANFDLLRVGRPKDRAAAAKRFQGWLGAADAQVPAEPAAAPPSDTPAAASGPVVAAALAIAPLPHTQATASPQPTGKPRRSSKNKDKPDDQFAFVFEN